jgi:hypothetical protein
MFNIEMKTQTAEEDESSINIMPDIELKSKKTKKTKKKLPKLKFEKIDSKKLLIFSNKFS